MSQAAPHLALVEPHLDQVAPPLAQVTPHIARATPHLAHVTPPLAQVTPHLVHVAPHCLGLRRIVSGCAAFDCITYPPRYLRRQYRVLGRISCRRLFYQGVCEIPKLVG